jgi:ABC-type sugar transport system substrate-binding protein
MSFKRRHFIRRKTVAKKMKFFAILLVLCLLGGALSAQVQNKKFTGPSDQTYYMCTFVSGVEYWVAAFEGFKDAARQMGVKAVYQAPPSMTVPSRSPPSSR